MNPTLFLSHRKHHCQVHHVGTNTLMVDQKLKRNYDPKSYYDTIYTPREPVIATRRGLAVPARVLPLAPQISMDLLSVTHCDFVEKPIYSVTKTKAMNNLETPRASFQGISTYKADYPQQIFDVNPTAPTLMRSTLPQIIEVQPSYVTTNQATLKGWNGNHQSKGYRELQEAPFFAGNFQKETVSAKDFSGVAIEGGRPSTTCKKKDKRHTLEGDFDDSTTNKTTYKLPQVSERGPVNLKGKTRVMEETMEPSSGNMNFMTQYREDNPGFIFRSSKRWMLPQKDSVHLFAGKLAGRSEQKSSFKPKHNRLPTYPMESGQKFQNKSVNQADYFKFWKLPPRVQYGDRCEHIYHPSQAKFEAESETKASFLPLNEKPAQIFKPLDARFNKEAPKYSNKLSDVTAYRTDFVPRPFPKPYVCPAEVLLQRA